MALLDVLPHVNLTSICVLVSCIWLTHACYSRHRQIQIEQDLARRHGCQLPPKLSSRWPLGLDRIKQIWEANAESHLLQFFSSVADEYNNSVYQWILLGPRAFHVMLPENLEVVLSTNFKDYGFGSRKAVFAPLMGNGIFTQEGPAWKHSRELLRKQFVRAQYQNLDHFHEHIDNLIARMPADGVIDLQPLFFNLTLDTTTALLFGQSVYSLRADIDQDAENKLFAESFNIAQDGLAKRFRIAPLQFFYNPASFRQACRDVHVFVEKYIERRRQKQSENDVDESTWFMDRVAEASQSSTDLRDQLLNVLIAGRDTTACCLSWTFRLLIRHPEVMQRVRGEIKTTLGSSPHATREQIKKMPYLARVIKESLRLYPPVPMNIRTALVATVLPTGGGPDGKSPMLVRKGELVNFGQYVQSRRKQFYGDDAHFFRPERWETGELADIGWAYAPFNGGPRQCLGEDFALMEVSYTIVRLLQTFEHIELPHGEINEPVGSEKQTLTLVLSSTDGCRVAIRP